MVVVSTQTNSSKTTVLSVFSTMMGGAMLTFPILYREAGILTCTIILVLSGIMSYLTCVVYVHTLRPSDSNMQAMVKRVLGPGWEKFWRLSTGVYLLFLVTIYLQLLVDQLYSVIMFIAGSRVAEKTSITLDTFSMQWLGIILFVPLTALLFIKNMNLMLKISEFGAYPNFIYLLYLVFKFVMAASSGSINMTKVHWFTSDIGRVVGVASLACSVHSVIVPFVRTNQNQSNNVRDLGISSLMGLFMYEAVGVVGALAVSDLQCSQTLVNCYLRQWDVLIVEITYFLGRLAIFPPNLEVGRTMLLSLCSDPISLLHFNLFNVVFMVVAMTVVILSPILPISFMMNFTGAVVAYFMIYLFPFMLIYSIHISPLPQMTTQLQVQDDQEGDCQLPQIDEAHSQSSYFLVILYAMINLVGLVIAFYGVYTAIQSLTHPTGP